ncbi:hypothetical protein EV641_10778 [Rhodococcus sp. SMB37]|nr:hypothetical protein EV641_10778 [Rhodococcus sp. SMB37]
MTGPSTRPASGPHRERVVLAKRRGARMVRTRVEVQQQTEVGDAMVRGLVRAQLGLALRIAVVPVCLLGAIPIVLALFPTLADLALWKVRVPWILLGFASYLLLLGCAWLYVRLAERNEQDFTDLTDD